MLVKEVREWMQTFPVKVHFDATIEEAKRLMIENKQGRIIVVDQEDHIVGILTDSDVLRSEEHQITVDKVMNPMVVTINEEQTIRDAGRLLIENNIAGLPVVDTEGKVVGLLTSREIQRLYG